MISKVSLRDQTLREAIELGYQTTLDRLPRLRTPSAERIFADLAGQPKHQSQHRC